MPRTWHDTSPSTDGETNGTVSLRTEPSPVPPVSISKLSESIGRSKVLPGNTRVDSIITCNRLLSEDVAGWLKVSSRGCSALYLSHFTAVYLLKVGLSEAVLARSCSCHVRRIAWHLISRECLHCPATDKLHDSQSSVLLNMMENNRCY